MADIATSSSPIKCRVRIRGVQISQRSDGLKNFTEIGMDEGRRLLRTRMLILRLRYYQNRIKYR